MKENIFCVLLTKMQQDTKTYRITHGKRKINQIEKFYIEEGEKISLKKFLSNSNLKMVSHYMTSNMKNLGFEIFISKTT